MSQIFPVSTNAKNLYPAETATAFVVDRKYVSAKHALKHALNPAFEKDTRVYSTEILMDFFTFTDELVRLDRAYFQLRKNHMLVGRKLQINTDSFNREPSEVTIAEVLGNAYQLQDQIRLQKENLHFLPDTNSNYREMKKALQNAFTKILKGVDAIIDKYI